MKNVLNRILNYGYKSGTVTLALVLLFTMSVGLAGCNQQADIQKVLNLLPTVQGITNSIGAIVAGADPAIAMPVDAALVIVNTSFATVEGILKTYQNNLNSAPQSVINDLDAAIAAIQSNLVSIEGQIPGLSAAIIAGINVGLSALEAILGFVASLLPAPVAAKLFPKAFAALHNSGVAFGTNAVIPAARPFAQTFNANMDSVGNGAFRSNKKAHIHVPWHRVLGVPVMP